MAVIIWALPVSWSFWWAEKATLCTLWALKKFKFSVYKLSSRIFCVGLALISFPENYDILNRFKWLAFSKVNF
uniref:Uncharacterized protein n=1 Tax=Anguilla anguilla TaxID=7936 RepID=A0A0E9X1W1_ANGAN